MGKAHNTVGIAACLLGLGFGAFGQRGIKISIRNPIAVMRTDELLVLKRRLLEKRLGRLGRFVHITVNGQKQIVQHDDLDGDGTWDEVAFLYSIGPKEQITCSVQTFSKPHAAAMPRAHVRLKKRNADGTYGLALKREEMPLLNPPTDFSKGSLPLYLTEGPGWENDKVAFRLYFDVRNGKDIFGKRTARMVLDSVGTKPTPSYHNLQDWGMDVLHAGKSLGAGALALLVPMAGGDTLVRLGGDHVKRTAYEQLADGPVRALFRLTYDWEIGGNPVQVTEQTGIWGGQIFYESSVAVTGAPAGTKLVIGIADFYNNVFQTFSERGATVLLSHGRQSENKDGLGMAVMAPAQSVAFAGSAPAEGSDILNTYYIAQHIPANAPNVFRFYAGWEKDDSRFAQLSYFKQLLQTEAEKKAHPVIIQ